MRLFRRRRVYADREVLELFADEPELVAIVDAVAATQRRHLRRRGPLVAAAATATVVAVVVGVLLPWRGGDVGFVEAARAAVGDGRVVHAVSGRVDNGEQLVDLRTGVGRPTRVEVETWYDERSGRLRAVTRREGVVVADALGVATVNAAELTALDFGRGYRTALDRADDDADEVGDAALVRLRVRGIDYDVVIDRETHLPRRYRRAEDGVTWSVSGVESRPLQPPDFRTRLEPPRYTSGAVASSTRTAITAAAERLPGLVWAGARVGSRRLTDVRAERLVSRGRAGVATATGVRLSYGDGVLAGGVEIRQAAAPEPAYGFAEARRTLGFNPLPPPGTLDLVAPGGAGVWTGQLRVGAVHVVVRATTRDAVIALARSLRPYS